MRPKTTPESNNIKLETPLTLKDRRSKIVDIINPVFLKI